MIAATVDGKMSFMKTIVRKHNASINKANKYGHTALTWGAICGRIEIVEVLLELGADIDNETFNGKTALSAAVAAGQERMGKLFY